MIVLQLRCAQFWIPNIFICSTISQEVVSSEWTTLEGSTPCQEDQDQGLG